MSRSSFGYYHPHALTASPNVAIPALRTGMIFNVIASAANTSGTVTFNVQSLGAKNVKKSIGAGQVALGVGDIQIGMPMTFVYDGANMLWVNPPVFSHAADIASAATLNLDNATGDLVDVTGTTTITAITLSEGSQKLLRFTGALTLTNGASLVVQGGANFVTAAGDMVLVRGYASGVVRVILFPIGGYASLTRNGSFTKAQRGTPVQLTQAATIAVDFSLANNFYTTMTGNRTLGAPSNVVAGQSGAIEIFQDGTGSRTLAYNAAWLFVGGIDPVLTTTANGKDVLFYYVGYNGDVYASLNKAFA